MQYQIAQFNMYSYQIIPLLYCTDKKWYPLVYETVVRQECNKIQNVKKFSQKEVEGILTIWYTGACRNKRK